MVSSQGSDAVRPSGGSNATPRFVLVLTMGYLVSSAAATLGEHGFPFELVSHLRPQLFAAGLALVLLGLFCLVGSRANRMTRGLLLACLLFILAHGLAVASSPAFVVPTGEVETSKARLRIVWSNLFLRAEAVRRLPPFAKDADVLVFTELPPDLETAMGAAFPSFAIAARTCGVSEARGRGCGGGFSKLDVAVFVQNEGAAFEVHPCASGHLELARARTLCVTLETKGGRLSIIAAHPAPALSSDLLEVRNAVFDAIARAAPSSEPFVVIGDFNVTPWVSDYRRLPGRRAGDPRWTPTWLSPWPWLGLPIDHAFVGPGVDLVDVSVGRSIGSDHFPIVIEVAIPPDAEPVPSAEAPRRR